MIRGSWGRHPAVLALVRCLSELESRLPTAQELREGLEAFVRWWATELWACLPPRCQTRLRHRHLQFFVRVRDGETRIVVDRNDGGPTSAFALTPESDEDAASLVEIQRAIRK